MIRTEAYDKVTVASPQDLHDWLAALDAVACRDAFDRLPPAYRRNELRWIAIAKRDAPRTDRIARAVGATQASVRMPNL